jgi:hypothetical protein
MNAKNSAFISLLICSINSYIIVCGQQTSYSNALLKTPTEDQSLKLQPGGRFDALIYLNEPEISSGSSSRLIETAPGSIPANSSHPSLIIQPSEKETAYLMPGGAFDALEKPKPTGEIPLVKSSTTPDTDFIRDADLNIPPIPIIPIPSMLEPVQKTHRMSDGSVYYGWMTQDKPHGFGLRLYPNGETYAGHWNNGSREGIGLVTKGGKTTYAGCWKNNLRDGMGMLNWSNGTRYAGEWKNGKMQGLGILAQPDGRRTGGKWEQNAFAEVVALPNDFFSNPVFRPPAIGIKTFSNSKGESFQGILLHATNEEAWILRSTDHRDVKIDANKLDASTKEFLVIWQTYFGIS